MRLNFVKRSESPTRSNEEKGKEIEKKRRKKQETNDEQIKVEIQSALLVRTRERKKIEKDREKKTETRDLREICEFSVSSVTQRQFHVSFILSSSACRTSRGREDALSAINNSSFVFIQMQS